MFFNSSDLDLASAVPGSFAPIPSEAMIIARRRDYAAISGMIFGDILQFDDVLASVAALEAS